MPVGRLKEEEKSKRRLSLYLDGEQYEFLERNSISKSALVRKALDSFMEKFDGNKLEGGK